MLQIVGEPLPFASTVLVLQLLGLVPFTTLDLCFESLMKDGVPLEKSLVFLLLLCNGLGFGCESLELAELPVCGILCGLQFFHLALQLVDFLLMLRLEPPDFQSTRSLGGLGIVSETRSCASAPLAVIFGSFQRFLEITQLSL